VVLGESALAFVGLGPADGISLGVLLEQGALGMLRAPHVLIVSASAVAIASGGLQLAAEGVRRWVHAS
jgi:ABC-type dipeptide/oligopeptide/nickel transport system permease subunit